MKNSPIIPFDETLAMTAADLSLKEGLAMADAMIAATARDRGCGIITSDADLKNLPNVTCLPTRKT